MAHGGVAQKIRGERPVLWVWLFLLVVTNIPYARAWVLPPRGTAFLGFFYAIPDVYNYLSYVQQAEDGHFLFSNKLYPTPHRPSLVNLEWWVVGRLSALVGRHPTLAYRLFGAAVTLALLLAADRWLRLSGLPESHRFAALLLIVTGGGFGGLLYERLGPPAWRFLDLTTGLYPFVSVLVNPHFVAGTALLLWALWAFHGARDLRGEALAVALGSALVLVRPYELPLLVGIRGLVVLTTLPARSWLRAARPLLALSPAFAFGWLVLVANPAFGSMPGIHSGDRLLSAVGSGVPPGGSIVLALAPAAVGAVIGAAYLWRRAGSDVRPRIAYWMAWPLVVVALLLLPFAFVFQSATNLGLPLLALLALALARRPPAATLLAALCLSSTGLVALRVLLEDNPNWFVPRERLEVAHALRAQCRRGDLLLAPPDIGLYADAYSPCQAYIAHLGVADGLERSGEVERFYATSALERAAWLERSCVRFVALPGDQGLRPEGFLGPATPFRRTGVVGAGPNAIGLYVRDGPVPCPPWIGR